MSEALAKRLAEEETDPDEDHQAKKNRNDLLDEEARLQKRLQEIQLKKQMPQACKAATGQIEQQAERGLQGHPEQAPLQNLTGNTSPEEVLPRRAAAPAVAKTPTPPEDTPSEGGAPREAHVQADAPTASLMSLAVRAHATEANDWSSGVSQPTGEPDADEIASVAVSVMSEYVLEPTVV